MMAVPTSTVQVYVGPDRSPQLVGKAYINTKRATVTTTFNYDVSYLANPLAMAVSPDLPLTGRVSVNGLPGAMADSAPDRWGRKLIERHINAQAHQEGRTPPIITEVDYLMGVSDLMRHGALRYRKDGSDDFLAQGVSVPLLIDLAKVLNATEAVVDSDTEDELAAIKFLLQAGSAALGGARPKASIRDGDQLYIAKFPHKSDEWDVMAWEKTALDLAGRCGISVPLSQLLDVGGKKVLLLERFDRNGDIRVPYISAMTMLGGSDGGDYDYIELSEALSNHGSSVRLDLEQLWRRVAFSIAIHNTDDHMRNHGFLWTGSGWVLSPVFDINPNPVAASFRTTTIGYQNDSKREADALFKTIDNFQIDNIRAKEIWSEVLSGVSKWQYVATSYGISKSEQRKFAPVLDKYLIV